MRDKLRTTALTISREKAISIRPILRWIKEGAPRARERLQATRILREIEGVENYKQILLTRGEAELLSFVFTEFPEGVEPERQLELFTSSPAPFPVRKPVEGETSTKLGLKTKLTAEEQAERDLTIGGLGYKPKSESYWQNELKKGSQRRK